MQEQVIISNLINTKKLIFNSLEEAREVLNNSISDFEHRQFGGYITRMPLTDPIIDNNLYMVQHFINVYLDNEKVRTIMMLNDKCNITTPLHYIRAIENDLLSRVGDFKFDDVVNCSNDKYYPQKMYIYGEGENRHILTYISSPFAVACTLKKPLLSLKPTYKYEPYANAIPRKLDSGWLYSHDCSAEKAKDILNKKFGISNAMRELYSPKDLNVSSDIITADTLASAHKLMLDTFKAKNADYGNAFEHSLDEFGPIAAITRMDDKISRLKSLIKQDAKVKDESMKDTALDLANYATMLYVYLKGGDDK